MVGCIGNLSAGMDTEGCPGLWNQQSQSFSRCRIYKEHVLNTRRIAPKEQWPYLGLWFQQAHIHTGTYKYTQALRKSRLPTHKMWWGCWISQGWPLPSCADNVLGSKPVASYDRCTCPSHTIEPDLQWPHYFGSDSLISIYLHWC